MAAGEQQAAIEGYRNHGVFTYALLEGFANADSSDQVQLFDLADYVTLRVPQLSRELKACEARGAAGVLPEARGDAWAYAQLSGAAALSQGARHAGRGAPQIATKPTHAVLAAADLLDTAKRGAAVKRRLERGDLVTVIGSEAGWAYVAQDGRALGYVEESNLLPLRN